MGKDKIKWPTYCC